MVEGVSFRRLSFVFLSLLCLFSLTGCPGVGDRMHFDETAQVYRKGSDVCITIINAQDYQPVDMGINLRNIPPKKKHFDFSPMIKVINGSLCIPSSYHHFKEGSKYIVEFVLHSAKDINAPRSFVIGVGVDNDRVYNFPLTGREISRPYGSVDASE